MPHITRRHMLSTLAAAGTSAAVLGARAQETAAPAKPAILGDPRVRGPFPILSTPYTESGDVDYDVLARQAQFVDRCGSPGMIWPQSNDSIDLLTTDEKLKGMTVLAEAMRGRRTALCLGVQGKDTEEMLIFAKHAESLAPTAFCSRPPDTGQTEDDLRAYWNALAGVTKRPVIIQTTGHSNYKGPAPSVKLLVELAKAHANFGYVKEESGNIMQRMRELIAAKPDILRVFSAWGGPGWLHQSRLGTEGLITERAAYADLLARIWQLMDNNPDSIELEDAFSKLLLMININVTVHGHHLRGPHLHVWKMRGIFKNTLSREYGPKNATPEKPILHEYTFSQSDKAETERRFAALKPYLIKD